MINYPRPDIRKLVPYFVLTSTYILLALVYWHFDFVEFHKYEVFPYDSGFYHDMAKHYRDFGLSRISEPNPLGPRMLFPLVYGTISSLTGLSLFICGYLVNIISVLIVCLGTLRIWIKRGISQSAALLSIILFLLLSSGPFRMTSNYIGQFGFECLLTFITLISIYKLITGTKIWMLISPVAVFFASLGREFTIGISLGTLIILEVAKRLPSNLRDETVANYRIKRLWLCMITGMLGYLVARWAVPNNHAFEWSLAYTLQDTFRTNLNLVNFIYPFYGGLGIFIVLIVANFSRKTILNSFIVELKKSNHFVLIIAFSLVSIFIAFLGGPDRDRYLLWYFPLFGYFALVGLRNLRKSIKNIRFLVVIILVSGLCWTRFYVPSLPHTVFNKDFPTQIKTDYNPKFYFGLPYMKKLRVGLKEFIVKSDSTTPMDRKPSVQKVYFAETQSLSKKGLEHMPVVYKNHANYIPFPLGIPSNQYEMLSTHPYWGNYRVRIALLAQWVAIQILVIAIIRRKSKVKS